MINRKKILSDYKKWVDKVSEDLEDKSHFTMEEIVEKVCELAEQQVEKAVALAEVSKQRELLFCGGCGTKLTYKVETDINSYKICRNKLCKQNNCA